MKHNLKKTTLMAAAAMVAIAASNVYVANNKEKASTIALSQVEAQAGNSSEWTWNNVCDWFVYGLRADERRERYDCVSGAKLEETVKIGLIYGDLTIGDNINSTSTNASPIKIICCSGGSENCDKVDCN